MAKIEADIEIVVILRSGQFAVVDSVHGDTMLQHTQVLRQAMRDGMNGVPEKYMVILNDCDNGAPVFCCRYDAVEAFYCRGKWNGQSPNERLAEAQEKIAEAITKQTDDGDDWKSH